MGIDRMQINEPALPDQKRFLLFLAAVVLSFLLLSRTGPDEVLLAADSRDLAEADSSGANSFAVLSGTEEAYAQTEIGEDEASQLKEELAALLQENEELQQREKEAADRLRGLEAEYEVLKNGSVSYLKLKGDLEATKVALSTTERNLLALTEENESLKLYRGVRWYFIRILVVSSIWFAGFMMGRYLRRRQTSYYM